MPPQSAAAAGAGGSAAGVIPPPTAPLTYRDFISKTAEGLGIAPALAIAIAERESGGVHQKAGTSTLSKKGAIGFFQLMPETAAELGVDPYDPQQNAVGGLRYLKRQIDAYGGDVRLALAAYNAGPGNVKDRVPDIPETQEYVKNILERWQAASANPQAAPAPAAQVAPAAPVAQATAPPDFATAGQLPASTASSTQETPYRTPAEREAAFTREALQVPLDALKGARAGIARTIQGAGLTYEQTGIPRPPGMPPETTQDIINAAPSSLAGKAGLFAEQAAEFAIPQTKITKARQAMQMTAKLVRAGISPGRARLVAAVAEGGAQALAAAGISNVHGEDPTSSAVIAAATPIAATAITQMGPAIKQVAIAKMARFMERGVTGDITDKIEKDIAQAASDFIELPLQRTWRQMVRTTRGIRKTAGETLESGLAGPFGDVPIPKQPVIDHLDDFVQKTSQQLHQVQGGSQLINTQKDVIAAVEELKDALGEYTGDFISARNLHGLKKVWAKAIYGPKDKIVASTKELLTSAQKEAREAGTEGIMRVLDTHAPSVAALDDAVHHAALLNKFTKGLAQRARQGTLATAGGRRLVGGLGGAVGAGVGSLVGGHPIIGMQVGWAAASMLTKAITSPRWRLLPIAARRRLAGALATGNAETARKILTPFILAGTADQDNLLNQGNRADRPETTSLASER